MAMGTQIKCDKCGRGVMSWDDGNPYYIDEQGQKHYAYHPDHEALERCIGNDAESMCLDCGLEFKVDSRAPVTACPGCHSTHWVETSDLPGKRCPSCKSGTF
ncbi:MAG: hypothetical protein ACKOFW_07580, partial [Planctomycetaceae bacterium]